MDYYYDKLGRNTIIYQYFPIISFYIYKDYLFIRPAYKQIKSAFHCSYDKKIAVEISKLLVPFSNDSSNITLLIYNKCLNEIRSTLKYYCSKYMKKSSKKCKKYCM